MTRWFVFVLLLGLAHQSASAQERIVGQRNLYSFEVPPGWTRIEDDSQADVVLAAPQGPDAGRIYAGLSRTEAPLADEMGDFAGREAGALPIEIGGIPCLGASTKGLDKVQNYLMCQLWVTFADGSARITFFLGSASSPEMAADHQRIFSLVAHSLDFGAALAP